MLSWRDNVVQDLDMMHSSLQEVLRKLALPQLARLHSTTNEESAPPEELTSNQPNDAVPSCDNSPRLTPQDDALPHVPIQSVYHLTKLRALRSPHDSELSQLPKPTGDMIDDFISRGGISLEDAERLFRLYMDRLDHFMYGIGGRYSTLETLRRRSPMLTACICTVAALHDTASNSIYGVCSREFRRLMAASMFDRRIDRDHLRAMCVATYWLSDTSWTVSGYAIRRAAEVNLQNNYHRVVNENSEDAADCMRLWYILYICDQHLSTLYGRTPIVREDFSVQGWEGYLRSPITQDSDTRLISQVALLIIIHNVRELFGPDTSEPIPQVYSNQIATFNRQLDQWVGHWSTALQSELVQTLVNYPQLTFPLDPHEYIGQFPKKGVLIHFHFAKLHLHSHVFRGLGSSPIPSYFLDGAIAAVSAATSVIDLLLTDSDLREGLMGMPSYMHSMTAFACVFLLKVSVKYEGSLIEQRVVFDLTTRLVQQFRSTPVGRWHLVHLMADGLEKMAQTLLNPSVVPSGNPQGSQLPGHSSNIFDMGEPEYQRFPNGNSSLDGFGNDILLDYNIGLGDSPFLQFDTRNLGFNQTGDGVL